MSEKFRFEDPAVQALMTRLHLDFKRRNGYSEMEIAGKRSALENVLIADTRERHASRLEDVGFRGVTLWQAHLNFGTAVGPAFGADLAQLEAALAHRRTMLRHGDLPRWREALASLPAADVTGTVLDVDASMSTNSADEAPSANVHR